MLHHPSPIPVHLHIGSTRLETGSAGKHAHIYPGTGKVTGEIPLAGVEEMNRAVDAAAQAFVTWRPCERCRV